ncbi:MAG: OmpA family protein, partial [Cyanobacteria bacterium J06635_1]
SKTGSAALNQQLSQQRAQVVVNYLKQQGVGNNIVAEGKGFNEPLAGVAPADAKNQRTEIRLVRVN